MSAAKAKVAQHVRSMIPPGQKQMAFAADPDKYGDSAILLVKHEEDGPKVYLLTVLDVSGDERWFAEAMQRVAHI